MNDKRSTIIEVNQYIRNKTSRLAITHALIGLVVGFTWGLYLPRRMNTSQQML